MVIITGASSGIGKAIAEFYLAKGEHVVGISRTQEINHNNFKFVKCDLSDYEALEKFELTDYLNEDDHFILINNAGTIGSIKRSHEVELKDYYNVAVLNIVALQHLCSQFFHCNQPNKTIVNISSGAAQRPIPSWAAYCASKAAVDLFSETLQAEIDEMNGTTKVFSLAPGVVDTKMQVAIRNSNKNDFSSHQKFVDLKESNELRSPEEVAELLYEWLNESDVKNVVGRL